jgi:gas vesicle protein
MLLAILQAASPEVTPFWPGLGIGGVLAAVVLKFYRDDRKTSEDRYEKLAKEAQERYAALAKEAQDRYAALAKDSNERAAELAGDFRLIVQDNTRALTVLAEKISAISSGDAVTVRQLMEAIASYRRPTSGAGGSD